MASIEEVMHQRSVTLKKEGEEGKFIIHSFIEGHDGVVHGLRDGILSR